MQECGGEAPSRRSVARGAGDLPLAQRKKREKRTFSVPTRFVRSGTVV